MHDCITFTKVCHSQPIESHFKSPALILHWCAPSELRLAYLLTMDGEYPYPRWTFHNDILGSETIAICPLYSDDLLTKIVLKVGLCVLCESSKL